MNERKNKVLTRYKNLSAPAKAGIWFTVCGVIQKGISFITVPIFTRLLTTSQYGTVSVYNSWLGIVSIFCTFNLFYGGFNNGMIDFEKQRDKYVASIQGLITTITVVWVCIYFIGRRFWNNLFEMGSVLIFVMFLEILASAALSLWSARERYEFRYKNLVIITVANAFFSSFLSIIAILILNKKYAAEYKIIFHALIVFLICGSIYIYNFRKGKSFFDRNIWRGAFLFNFPLIPHYLSTMILNQADRIMIAKMVGSAEAGVYSVAYSASMVLTIMITAANNSFAPWLYGRLKEKDYESVPKVTNMLFLGIAMMLVFVIALAPEAIYILAGKNYSEAILIVPSVTTSLYFIFMYQIFANVEFYFKKNYFIAYASMLGAIVNVVLNYFGILWLGYIAAGYTTLICYILFGISHYVFMKKICHNNLQNIELFDSKIIFLVAIVLVIFAMIMTLLYNYVIIRYVILLFFCLVLMRNKKTLKYYVNILKNK